MDFLKSSTVWKSFAAGAAAGFFADHYFSDIVAKTPLVKLGIGSFALFGISIAPLYGALSPLEKKIPTIAQYHIMLASAASSVLFGFFIFPSIVGIKSGTLLSKYVLNRKIKQV
jgi:hypothetical protein